MSKYLLPCECGKAIAIDASQAGQQIACECGKQLEVPTLRGVRELEPAPETTPSSRPAADWDASRGMVFAGSVILFVIGAAVAGYGWLGVSSAPNITREAETGAYDQMVDSMSLNEVYDRWKLDREHGLGERGQNPYVNIRSFRARRMRMLVTGIAFCAIGVIGTFGATLGRRRSPA